MGGGLLLAERFGLLFEERNQAPWEPTPHCGQVGETPRLCSGIVEPVQSPAPHCGLTGVRQRLCGGIVTPALLLILHCGQVGGHQLSQRVCWATFQRAQPRTVGTDSALRTSWRTPIDYAVA